MACCVQTVVEIDCWLVDLGGIRIGECIRAVAKDHDSWEYSVGLENFREHIFKPHYFLRCFLGSSKVDPSVVAMA